MTDFIGNALVVLTIVLGAVAAGLLRWAYVTTDDPTTRRRLASCGWPLLAAAVVFGMIAHGFEAI